MTKESTFEGWAILELMGHRRLAGYIRQQELAGHGFIRIDVPKKDGDPGDCVATQFYSPGSVYCLTPTSEEIARAVAATSQPEPAHRWELPAPAAREDEGEELDDGPACEFCGCTENNACDGGCSWDEDLLMVDRYVCDRCVRLAKEIAAPAPVIVPPAAAEPELPTAASTGNIRGDDEMPF